MKDCAGYLKAFEVQNNYVKQNILVCDPFAGKQISGQSAGNAVYTAAFKKDDQAYQVTIGQDYSSIDLSDQKAANASLGMFGISSYEDDLKQIIASIKVEE